MHSRLLLMHFYVSHLSHQSESSLGVIRNSFEKMDQWGAHVGELSVEPTNRLATLGTFRIETASILSFFGTH